MRDIEQQRIALECLKLAYAEHLPDSVVVERAEAFFAFVTGSDAETTLAAIRECLSRPRL